MRRLQVSFAAILVIAMTISAGVGGRAQTPGKVYRLGVLAATERSIELTRRVTLPELAKLGFVEGRNLIVDPRIGSEAALPGLARDLVAAAPDAIIAVSAAAGFAREATSTVPIIIFGPDPVRQGLVESLARPGGNVTGVAILATELNAKRLDLLHEAVPTLRRVAALLWRTSPEREASEREMRAVAERLGLELFVFDVGRPEDYPATFAAMRSAAAQALTISAHAELYRDSETLAALALEARVPTVCEWAEMARDGCLLGYGPSLTELRRRLALYAARIFQGMAPGELPIEGPTRFELAVNLKTARALGIEIPPALLARADEVIE